MFPRFTQQTLNTFAVNLTTYLHSIMIDTSETAILQSFSMLCLIVNFFFGLSWSVTENTVSEE